MAILPVLADTPSSAWSSARDSSTNLRAECPFPEPYRVMSVAVVVTAQQAFLVDAVASKREDMGTRRSMLKRERFCPN